MKRIKITTAILLMIMMTACLTNKDDQNINFNFELEKFADLRILRYQVPGFEDLSLQQKKLIYYLSQAAICGRDILWDQNGKYNLSIRNTIENIYKTYAGNRQTDDFSKFLVYLKRIEFSNGIYHHYSSDKIIPEFSKEYFNELITKSESKGFPVAPGETLDETIQMLIPVIFDKEVMGKKVNQDSDKDMVTNSAINFYKGVNQSETESFYSRMKIQGDTHPISYGLNSTVFKDEKGLKELPWKSGGLYGPAIDKIIEWLGKAKTVAENPLQILEIEKLISYYKTGDLKTWDEYNVIWVTDTSRVDFVNGFIENYSDPLGMKATWESVVNFKDIVATKRTEKIASNAQWFEDHSPVDKRFKKKEVKGVTAKVITVAMLGGDCYPYTPIGINLPNADWIRKEHGSKSVTLENISFAINQADLKSGFLQEFSYDENEIELVKKYGAAADNLHTDLHECLGHGSGQLLPGVSSEALKNYGSALEEARADLFALYYMMDPKMVELGLIPSLDAAKAHYISYIRNGIMTQLKRIKLGDNIQQSHMRNRQLIAIWCYEKGKDQNIIEKIVRDHKTYFRINDFEKLRSLMGELLKEVQRIKSEGDYETGKQLVENYGVQVDRELHAELLERFGKLHLAPYSGFINPEYELVNENGDIKDIKIKYIDNYLDQMMKYGKEYSFLPVF
jgi:dipeptidyl-peptidase III